jgi:hypothetical protein
MYTCGACSRVMFDVESATKRTIRISCHDKHFKHYCLTTEVSNVVYMYTKKHITMSKTAAPTKINLLWVKKMALTYTHRRQFTRMWRQRRRRARARTISTHTPKLLVLSLAGHDSLLHGGPFAILFSVELQVGCACVGQVERHQQRALTAEIRGCSEEMQE